MLGLLLLTLKGTPFIYQGQEIGMTNFDFISLKDVRDIDSLNADKLLKKLLVPKNIRWNIIKKSSRDNVRTPYQWNEKKHGGFTNGIPWLNVNKNYNAINYDSQKKDKNSILTFYKKIIKIRKDNEVLVYGDFNDLIIKKSVFVFERYNENTKLIIAINITKKTQRINFIGKIILSNYKREQFDGTLSPFEGSIILETTKHGEKR